MTDGRSSFKFYMGDSCPGLQTLTVTVKSVFNGKEQENYQLLGRRLEVNFPIVRHFDSFKREASVYLFPDSGSLFLVPRS